MACTDRLITLDRLKVVIEAYGADPDRWPADERAAAAALMESSDEARALFAQAAELDRMLDHMAEPTVSRALARRVRAIEIPPRRSRFAGLLALIGDWLQPGSRFAWQSTVAAAAVIGIVAGIGFSEFVLDKEMPAVRPVVMDQRAGPLLLVSGTGAGSLALEQDIQVLSLTGRDGIGTGTAWSGDDSEASPIPLY